MLQVYFSIPDQQPSLDTQLLPRPTSDAGTYLFGFTGQLFSYGRNGLDQGLRRWDADASQWREDQQTPPLAMEVAGQILFGTSSHISYAGHPVLVVPSAEYRFGEWYYAEGNLIVRLMSSDSELNRNELRA